MLNPRSSLLNAGCTSFVISISIFVAETSVLAQTGNTSGITLPERNVAVRSDLAFDVISIRPSNASDNEASMSVLPTGDEYRVIGMPLGWAILMAYFPFPLQSKERLVGAPSWVWNDKYDIVGKVGEADLQKWHQFSERGFVVENPILQTMLQNALADRCKMTVHRIPAQVDGYDLVIAKYGPNRKNLVESKPDDVIPDRTVKLTYGGRMVPIRSHDEPVLHFYQTSMPSFVSTLSPFGGVVEDKTGLTGKYRFDLTRLDTEGTLSSNWDLAPLGLKLSPAKIPTENIVIDHIERPSPN